MEVRDVEVITKEYINYNGFIYLRVLSETFYKKTIRDNRFNDIGLTYKPVNKITMILNSLKDKIDINYCKDSVYMIKFRNCGMKYI